MSVDKTPYLRSISVKNLVISSKDIHSRYPKELSIYLSTRYLLPLEKLNPKQTESYKNFVITFSSFGKDHEMRGE